MNLFMKEIMKISNYFKIIFIISFLCIVSNFLNAQDCKINGVYRNIFYNHYLFYIEEFNFKDNGEFIYLHYNTENKKASGVYCDSIVGNWKVRNKRIVLYNHIESEKNFVKRSKIDNDSTAIIYLKDLSKNSAVSDYLFLMFKNDGSCIYEITNTNGEIEIFEDNLEISMLGINDYIDAKHLIIKRGYRYEIVLQDCMPRFFDNDCLYIKDGGNILVMKKKQVTGYWWFFKTHTKSKLFFIKSDLSEEQE